MSKQDTISFAEWRPDMSDRANPTAEAKGCISIAGQYGPFADIVNYNGTLAATTTQCLGGRTFYDSTGAPHLFLGDATHLFHLESRIAVDRSISGGYSLSTDGTRTWEFEQFGDNVVAISDACVPQVYNMLTPTTPFAALAGSPPANAVAACRVGDFLWLGAGFTVYWSGINQINTWAPSPITQAGSQALDQANGLVQCLVGLDYAAIFQERAIRRAVYIGPPVTWDFGQDYVERARGAISRNAAVPFGRLIYYVADDGMYVFDGVQSTPIGYGKIDSYFTGNLNYGYRSRVCAAIDPLNKLFVVGYPSGPSTIISELLIYSIQDQRWTHDFVNLEHFYTSPVDIFTVDTFSILYPSNNLDDPTINPNNIDSAVFDDSRRRLAGVQPSAHQLGMFSGLPRAATIDTGEFEPEPGRRAKVSELWPMGDFPQTAVSGALGYRRALPMAGIAYTNPTAMNNQGFCSQLWDARFLRARLLVAAGAIWRRAEGVEYKGRLSGKR